MENKLAKLKTLLGEVNDIGYASAVLGWDQQTYMPPGGAEARGYQLATLDSIAHIKFTAPEIGQLIEDLKPYVAEKGSESDDAAMIRVVSKNYDRAVKVPTEWVAKFSQITSEAHGVWAMARHENNFAKFQPYLEQILELAKEYATFFAPYDHVYDVALDQFEPGMKTADVKAIFQALRPQQVELIKAIASRPQVDDSFLHQNFDEQKQWDFGVEVITKFGYDWNRGRQDKSAHPFTTSFSPGDVRITTRVYPDYLSSALFSTMHESGHGMYNQGISPIYFRTPLGRASSLAIHESQSRMWENLVGRSLPFWTHFYPRLQEAFPQQLGNVSLEAFYKGINKVEPSLVRVEADEATYNMHVMLRLEIEIDLLEGKLAVKDLPEAWNTRMQEYLGVTPPNDADGVLQDVHWSGGLIGYFPTYALGNLVSAQLWECIHNEIPDIEDQIRQGKFDALLGWLREKVHKHGAKYEPQDLVQRITGSKIDPQPYVRYLKNKYSDIYGF
jgi:carboxypeptidase Taq